ncbi:acyltransferase family protein, partial [Streptomyces sp. 900105755]
PDGWDLNDIPLAQACWSFGAVVVLLQYAPSWRELPRGLRRWDRFITLSNNRAVTIYLWHNMLIMATVPIIDEAYNLPFMNSDRAASLLDSTYGFWMFVVVWPLIAVAVVAFGWVEDVAAGRGARVWPSAPERRRAISRRRA